MEPKISDREKVLHEKHLASLTAWNEKLSLVSPASLATAPETHYLDSVFVCDIAEKYRAGMPVVDFGSGAGFPGLIFAMRFPHLRISLYERNSNKRSFLLKTVADLKLENVVLQSEFRFHVGPALLMSRAVAPPEELLSEFAASSVPGSRLLICRANEEPSNVSRCKKIGTESYQLPTQGRRFVDVFTRST